MNEKSKITKEISLLIGAFITIGILDTGYKYFEYSGMKKIATAMYKIFQHPLKVSNAALTIQVDIYKIHRDMKDIVLSHSTQERKRLATEVDIHEQRVYKNLNIIEKNILGEEGLSLQKETKQLFTAWRPIHNEVISLMNSNQTKEAIAITQGKEALHVLKLETSALKLYHYAQNKATEFTTESKGDFEKLETIMLLTGIVFLLIFIAIGSFIVYRISHFINKNEHLKNVLSVIRDVNQLIVREKNPQQMIQESCNILTSTGVYGQAWIVTYDDDEKVEYFATTDIENINLFKEKLESGWTPYCIKKTQSKKKLFSFVEDTKSGCSSCPIAGMYNDKSAFTIQLKYDEKLYGYLTLSIDKKYIEDKDELSLLDEVAGDIAYALYNIQREQTVISNEQRYRELFNNMQSAVAIYTSQDNGEKFIFSDLNTAAETIENIDKTSIIYKNVQEVFPGIEEYGLLDVFKRVYKTGVAEKFEMKEYKDERISGWRENYVYKLPSDELVAIYLDKTAEKNLGLELKKSEILYANIINSVENILFVKDQDYKYIVCNKAFEKFIGMNKDEIIGKNDYEIFEKEVADFFRKHDEMMIAENKSMSNFEWVTYPDGTKVYLLTLKSPLRNSEGELLGLVGNSADFTEQKKIHTELLKSKILYEKAEQIGSVGSWEYDIQTQQFWASKESKRIYGFDDDADAFTTEVVESCIPDKQRVHQALVDLIEKGTTYNLEFEIHPYDGSDYKIITSVANLEKDVEGKPVKVIGFIQDITELKKKDEMLINQSRHAAMGEMIGMIAHQWRQPLSVISMDANNMLVDIGLKDFSEANAKEYAEDIVHQTQHLSKTIDDFRNFFKPDKVLSQVKLGDVLDETYTIIKDSLSNNNIEFKKSYASESEVDAYPRELMQVFVNIISNAKDALVAKHNSDACIEVKVYEDDDSVITDIIDNGLGIDEKILPKIFDPYFSTKDEKSGTGLGLYMSKLIVEEHLHGKIEAFNIENGACFRIKLLKRKK